ncbi:ATP-dependent transcriptional regulator [Pseudomonas sp. PDM18]|uniref:LuxR C-terminal-related transcriptional regulator n=1 Tax=Pseudomonas sp. PDM18 TaxID=2769253 RepID=UPI0017802CDA|nr:LuxR C-terminal-related transcriptional regulator [Pseudomonas sp. PDM18]MBD9676561.1 ATP-dependent transcriptional regulator [Pseudomonas sp. PDM18]
MQGLGATLPHANGRWACLPALPSGHVPRQQLQARLRGSRQRLCLLCAPAGYGKSVLLGESLAQLAAGEQVVWLSLGGQVESLQALSARIALELDLNLPQGAGPATLLRYFATHPAPLKLVLDDLPGELSIELNNWFDHLLALPSSHLQLWVSSRQRPNWNLPRLMLRNELLELDAAELAMTRAEFERLLEVSSSPLPAPAREHLWQRAEGWWAGIRLLLSGGADSDPGKGLGLIRDYLEHELLARLGDAERNILYGLTHLPRFSTDLCAQLWEEHGGRQVLRRLLQCQAFIFPLEARGAWFRVLPVVAEALQERVEAAELSRLRLHSCRMLSIAGHLNEAIEQALQAEQPEVAANYMQKLLPSWQLAEHNLHRLLEWREQLPGYLLESTPRLIYLCSLALYGSGRLSEADQCLAKLERFLPCADPQLDVRLRANWQALRGLGLASRGQAEEACQACQEALRHLPSGDWISIVVCYSTLARLAMAGGRLAEARELLDEAVELARREGCLDSEVLINTDRLRLLILLDEVSIAEALLAETLEWRTSAHIPRDPLLARLLFLQGELHLLRGRVGAAEDSLRAGLAHAQHSSAPYIQFGHLLLAEAASRTGQHEQALLHLHETERRMHCGRIDSQCYGGSVLLHSLRVLARRGEWRTLLRRAGSAEACQPSLLHPSLPQEIELIVAQAEIALGLPQQARLRLNALAGDCASRRLRLLEREARALLRQLPEVAEKTVAASFDSPLKASPDVAEEASFCARLEDLTPRESAVLTLLARGMSNQEIADSLFLSVNTVKYHAKNINAKLGSTRRTQAIVFAKAMGLI